MAPSVFQNALYIGMSLENILYGIQLVLYCATMYVLLIKNGRRNKYDIFYAVFSTVMMLMTTIWVSTQSVFGEYMWLIDSDYPGGPDAYWAAYNAVWYMNLGGGAVTLLQLMTDALMIHRCRLIWGSYRVIILPVFLWTASLVLGIIVMRITSTPGGNFFSPTDLALGLAYYAASVGLTAVLTGMICYRMVTHGQMVKRYLGQEYASVYFALLAVIIESVLPYTLSGIIFLVLYGIASDTSIAFINVYFLMMGVSPQMVILRVASGRAWDEQTIGNMQPSTVKFTRGQKSTGCSEPHGAGDSSVDMVKSETA